MMTADKVEEVQERLQQQESMQALRRVRERSMRKTLQKSGSVTMSRYGSQMNNLSGENPLSVYLTLQGKTGNNEDINSSSSESSQSKSYLASLWTSDREDLSKEDLETSECNLQVYPSDHSRSYGPRSSHGYNNDIRLIRSMREQFSLSKIGKESSIRAASFLLEDSEDDLSSKLELSYLKGLMEDSDHEDLEANELKSTEFNASNIELQSRSSSVRLAGTSKNEYIPKTSMIDSRTSLSQGSNSAIDIVIKSSAMNVGPLDLQKMLDRYLYSLVVAYGNNEHHGSKFLQSQQSAMILMEKIYPRQLIHVDAWQLMNSVTKCGVRNDFFQKKYSSGDFAEFLEPDMTWTLDIVRKVHTEKDSDGTIKRCYNIGHRRRLSAYHMRAPEEALRRIFGARPWIWQQWVLLKLEEKLRFEELHDCDFESFNILAYARSLWFEWLLDPRNKDFVSYISNQRVIASQIDLFDHMMKPFYILDDIRRNAGWDFSDGFSIYSYLSAFGTGYFVCIVCLVMQFVIPAVIVLKTLEESNYYNEEAKDGILSILEAMFCVNDNEATCSSLVLTTFIVICIQVLYVIKVNPDATATFHDVCGVGGYGPDKTYSRFRSLRLKIFEINNDRFGQLIGAVIDAYMNTLYVYLVFAINLYNILNQASPTEVVLNALALEFVYNIDENYVEQQWWDNDKRWMKAGVMEIYIQSIFEFRLLRSIDNFCRAFNFDEELICSICNNDPNLFYNDTQAHRDSQNVQFMDHSDKHIFFICKKYASKLGDDFAEKKFRKQSVVFGFCEGLLMNLWFFVKKTFYRDYCVKYGLFNRMNSYRTWSRWDKALYGSPIPDLNNLFEKNAYGQYIVKKSFEREKHSDIAPFYNFSTKTRDPISIARSMRFDALTFRSLMRRLSFSIYWGEYGRCIVWLLNSILEWLSHGVQLMFPFYNLFLLAFAFHCVNEPLQVLQSDDEGVSRCNCQQVLSSESCLGSFVLSVYSNPDGTFSTNDDGQITFSCEAWSNSRKKTMYDIDLLLEDAISNTLSVIESTPSMIYEACGVDPDLSTEVLQGWL